ncbi:MAG: hypothetical protein J6M62_02635 [Selenomonadaceae bacterium]|nr:hypothetical protein [Selenomonadaceae bacterium]MBP3723823.1 hypothetical protein [Selenomonadaceae bacterium]
MKTNRTMEMEKALYEYCKADCLGVYGCFEVAIGGGYGDERIDFITLNSKDEFRCYEIKSSKEDFDSNAKLSFTGDFNYLLIPDELKEKINESEKLKKLFLYGVGLLLYKGNGEIVPDNNHRAKKKSLTMAKRVELMHCMVRSLSRYCHCEFNWIFKDKDDLDEFISTVKNVAAYTARIKEREKICMLLYEYLPRIGVVPERAIEAIGHKLEEEDENNDTE